MNPDARKKRSNQEQENPVNFKIESLGHCTHESPFKYSNDYGDNLANFVKDEEKMLYDVSFNETENGESEAEVLLSAHNRIERAGPREKIFFKPQEVIAAICTCGGLCPGLNDVIRSITRSLMTGYGVKTIWGIRYGFKGFLKDSPSAPLLLNPKNVDGIHTAGGTILGSARGGGDKTDEILDTIQKMGINMLFIIGGDGSQRGARDISDGAKKRGYKLAVVGVPKTIDNDLSFIHKSFGFETAVGLAQEAVSAAHTEAQCAINGVGLVKLMGRESGFIAAETALASQEANYVLIPEVPFDLEGEKGLLPHMAERLKRRGHAVVVVAEGAGSDLMEKELGKRTDVDAGGNRKMHDIGAFLKEKMTAYFKEAGLETNVRYIDPSYMIRASAPNSNDAIYCARLGSNAAHAAMAGKTNLVISLWNSVYVHVPIALATRKRNKVNPESSLWRDVIESTFQPISMKNL